jgi:nucleoside-diphosphate-sugar epimerase
VTLDDQVHSAPDRNTRLLVTGANGFIGAKVVETLLSDGYRNVRCLVRSVANRTDRLFDVVGRFPAASVEVLEGNLKSRQDCARAARGAQVVFHLAAGIEKSFAGCFANTVLTTRNLLDALGDAGQLKRFVNVSSLAVYSNFDLRRSALLDESCKLETEHVVRNEPYAYAKLKQDEIVVEYGAKHNLPYVIVRPGAVYGPGKPDITGRVGIGTFGLFLHLGGRNLIPFTHVENCARAIVLAGITPDIEGQVFNVIDDELPTSRQFMKGYRQNVGRLRYLSVPFSIFYLFCWAWEKYAEWSEGQLPPAFNRRRCCVYWKGNRYSNRKLKALLGWTPLVSFKEGSIAYFDYLKNPRRGSC